MDKTFYPLLLAIFPVLFFYSRNMEEVSISDIPLPMLVLAIGTLLFMLLLRLLTKDYNRIALSATICLGVSFLYIPIRDLFPTLVPRGIIGHTALWGSLYVVPILLVLVSKQNLAPVTKFLNVATITLLVIPIVTIGINQIRAPEPVLAEMEEGLTPPQNPPDIYYIVLDEYARDDYLKETLDYDNDLTPYLASKGFYIASKSKSDYPATVPSLASSLNMEYIDEAELVYAEKLDLMQNNRVSQYLKSVGYEYLFITSGALEHNMSRYAEVHAPPQKLFGIEVGRLAIHISQSTTLVPYLDRWIKYASRENILYSFREVAKVPGIDAPTFTFAHILCPHPPYVFDQDGYSVKQIGDPAKPAKYLSVEENRSRYLNQLIFVNKKVKALIEELLSTSSVPPIIIIQGDHGLRSEGGPKMYQILNAYYLPHGSDSLYESITPVNSFRVIFNEYFGTSYRLLRR